MGYSVHWQKTKQNSFMPVMVPFSKVIKITNGCFGFSHRFKFNEFVVVPAAFPIFLTGFLKISLVLLIVNLV